MEEVVSGATAFCSESAPAISVAKVVLQRVPNFLRTAGVVFV
jgi:hypothetical protein